jgi:hypothetical protein
MRESWAEPFVLMLPTGCRLARDACQIYGCKNPVTVAERSPVAEASSRFVAAIPGPAGAERPDAGHRKRAEAAAGVSESH